MILKGQDDGERRGLEGTLCYSFNYLLNTQTQRIQNIPVNHNIGSVLDHYLIHVIHNENTGVCYWFPRITKMPLKEISKPFEVINYSDSVLSMNLNTTM